MAQHDRVQQHPQFHHHHHREAVLAAAVDEKSRPHDEQLLDALLSFEGNSPAVDSVRVHDETELLPDASSSLLEKDLAKDIGCFKWRWIVISLIAVGTFILYLVRCCISVTGSPLSLKTMYHEYSWSKHDQGQVLASFYYGYICFQWLVPVLVGCGVGEFTIFFTGSFLSLIAHTLTPLVADYGLNYIVAARIITGAFECVTFPAMYGIISQWSPSSEKTTATGLILSGTYFGIVFTNVVAALMVRTMSWRYVFYIFGAAGFMWAFLAIIFVRSSPGGHPFITKRETKFIQQSCSAAVATKKESRGAPWLKILLNPSCYAIYLGHFAYNFVLYMLMSMMPSFFVDVFNLKPKVVGMASGGPFFFLLVVVLISTRVVDYIIVKAYLSTGTIRKICQTTGLGVSSMCLLLSAHMQSPWLSSIFMAIAVGSIGLCVSGYAASFLDVAPTHTPAVMSISNTLATIPGILTPKLCGWLLTSSGCKQPGDEGCREGYQQVFWVSFGVSLLSVIVYLCFYRAVVQIR